MISYTKASPDDSPRIFELCKQLIDDYENIDQIDYDRVLKWISRKIEHSIGEYTAVYADSQKVGFFHFYENADGAQELDDLYIFPEYQNLGIGSMVIQHCCAQTQAPVMLYVFSRNQRAISLYKRLDFQIVKMVGDTRFIMRREKGSAAMLYHGTVIPGLETIKANAKSHATGMPVAYFTEDRCYALVCCRSRNENFVTMGIRADGKQHYFERFPNQLEVLYRGKQGYLYCLESTDGLTYTKGHTWESAQDIPVAQCEVVADVYEEILREEAKGNLVIHRYSEIDPSEQKMHANHIRDHILDEGNEMAQFYYSHFSSLWDLKDK